MRTGGSGGSGGGSYHAGSMSREASQSVMCSRKRSRLN